jgi:hypothetical protein
VTNPGHKVHQLRWQAVTLAAAAVVLIAAAPATAQNRCGIRAASSWTRTETTVWQQLCAGQWADLNRPGQTLDPHKPDGWDDARVVSSTFTEQLLTSPYAAVIDRHGIRLRGAWFRGGLDLEEATINFPLRCQGCRIAGLQADYAVIDGTVDLDGSAIEGDLNLLGAHIGGNLEVNRGSVVSDTLTADRLTVTGDVFLRDGSRFNDIVLLDAHIGGELGVNRGSVVSGTLAADRLTVTGSVFLDERSTFNDIRLLGAHIGGDLYVNSGSVVSGTLNAGRTAVAGSVFLRDGSRFNDIRLLGAHIGGQLDASGGSVVSGTLAADRLTVTGSVFLDKGSTFHTIILSGAGIGGLILVDGARWASGGSLDLRQAHAGGLWTDDRADSWPATIKLNGFVFGQWAKPDPRTLGSGWFTGTWLARLDAFSPGPYNQLAAVMDATGHPTIAADVRYHRSNAERLRIPWSRPERWGQQLHWLVLGYGFRPWRAVGWLFAVWLLGFLVFWVRLQPDTVHPCDDVDGRPRPARMRRWRGRIAGMGRIRLVKAEGWSAGQAALYSLDRLLPAVKLASPDVFPARTRTQQVWSVAQMLLGWVLTLFIIGWLGSLLVHP